MLSLKRLTKGRWRLDGYIGGKRYRKTFKAPSERDAKEFRAKTEQDLWERHTLGRDLDATFTQCTEVYLEKGGEKRFLIPLVKRWGDTKVRDLTAAIVSRVASEIYPTAQPSTVRRQFYVPLNAVIAAGARANLCPPLKFEAPKIKKQQVDYAEDEWMAEFLANAHFRLATIVLFMTMTGARVTEACRLQVRDIEPGYATLRKTKTGASRRVRCPEVLSRALFALCEDKGREDEVFGYAGRDGVNKAIKRVCIRSGIRYLSSHKCGRHAFAARLLKQGASIRVVQEAGGWASIKLLSDTYGHIERSQVDKSIDLMGENTSLSIRH